MNTTDQILLKLNFEFCLNFTRDVYVDGSADHVLDVIWI